MPNLKAIRKRISSVKSTQQITKAMKMVAAAKLRRAQEAIVAARPYADKQLEVLSSIALRAGAKSHPLLARREPRKVLAEFGVELTDDVDVRVHDSTAELRYMVLPQRPAGTEDWSEAQLAALVTRDSLVGTQRALGTD